VHLAGLPSWDSGTRTQAQSSPVYSRSLRRESATGKAVITKKAFDEAKGAIYKYLMKNVECQI
jgi:hypothetical protein